MEECIEYRVWKTLEAWEPGTIAEVKALAPNRPKDFIEVVKYCINAGLLVEFNKDYTKIKRLMPKLETNEICYEKSTPKIY